VNTNVSRDAAKAIRCFGVILIVGAALAPAAAYGAAWQIQPAPAGTSGATLYGVTSAPGTSEAWAFGQQYEAQSGYRALVLSTTGGAWSASYPLAGQGILDGGVALSKGNVWAVGANGLLGPSRPHSLIEHWNGTAWSKTTPSQVGTYGDQLWSVSMLRATNTGWAVGEADYPGGSSDDGSHPLTIYWNGHSWKVVTSPSPDLVSRLASVAHQAGGSDYWAVGSSNDYSLPLAMHWTGSAWKIAPVPLPADSGGEGILN
jgi:hypothetical protein